MSSSSFSVIQLDACHFADCYALGGSSDGGGLAIYTGIVIRCTFTGCEVLSVTDSGTRGGAVRVWVNATLRSCVFEDCLAKTDLWYITNKHGAGKGGAVCALNWLDELRPNTIVVASCTFKGCLSENGGALYAEGRSAVQVQQVQVVASTFTDCWSDGCGRGGGAIMLQGYTYLFLHDSTIRRCVKSPCGFDPDRYAKEAEGGGVYVYASATLSAVLCIIENCSAMALSSGTAKGKEAPAAPDAVRHNASCSQLLPTSNITMRSHIGGGLHVADDSIASLEDCVIRSCTAESSTPLSFGGGVNIENSVADFVRVVIADCRATCPRGASEGGALCISSGGSVILDGCTIQRCSSRCANGSAVRALRPQTSYHTAAICTSTVVCIAVAVLLHLRDTTLSCHKLRGYV